MERKDRVVTFPWMGQKYPMLLKESLESMGLNVQLPPKTTERTIKLGVKHSAEMFCFPYKVTLGNFIEALENGANTLFMYDNRGECRLRHYYKIHEFTLRNLGYEFEMYGVSFKNMIGILRKLTGKSFLEIGTQFYKFSRKLKKIDEKKCIWSDEMPNIGIIGEIFSCCDERINYGIEDKIKILGANPFNTVTLSEFLREKRMEGVKGYFFRDGKEKYKKQARKYLNGPLGGHGFENIYHLLWLCDKGIDGVIHILPLSCMPESSVEVFIDKICQESKVPLLRIAIDENNSEANLDTRLETFVELIKMKK